MIFLNKKFSKYHDVRLGFMNFGCICNEYSYSKTKITFTNVMVTDETNTIKKDWYLFIERGFVCYKKKTDEMGRDYF